MHSRRPALFLGVVLILFGTSSLSAETRIFTDTQGRLIRGELVSVDGDLVTIKRDDGQTFTVKASTLSPNDIAYLQEHGPKTGAAPVTVVPDGNRKFQSPALALAQNQYTSTVATARKTLAQDLEAAFKAAMATGDLADANALKSAKATVDTGGEPPHGVFKAVKSKQALAAYDTVLVRAKEQYTGALQTTLKAAMGSGNLAEANIIQDEIKSIGGTPEKPGAGSSNNETADLVVAGKGFAIVPLENNTPAFTNRAYVWQKIPPTLHGYRYTKIAGGAHVEIKVRAKRDAVLEVMTCAAEPGTNMAGWERTGIVFTWNDGKNSRMVVFKKKIEAGQEIEVPEGNWSGALVLLPGK